MTESLCVELIKQIPSLLWFVLVLILVLLNYRRIRDNILPNLSSFKALGVEFEFVTNSIDAAIELGEKSDKWQVDVPEKDKEVVLKRAKQHLTVFNNARILWLDDRPENNRNERRMFRQLRAVVELATTTQEALEKLTIDIYDVVISDIGRDQKGDPNGLQFLEAFHKFDQTTPVIFYVGEFDPDQGTPKYAFGITNRPDQLLHLVLDALERNR